MSVQLTVTAMNTGDGRENEQIGPSENELGSDYHSNDPPFGLEFAASTNATIEHATVRAEDSYAGAEFGVYAYDEGTSPENGTLVHSDTYDLDAGDNTIQFGWDLDGEAERYWLGNLDTTESYLLHRGDYSFPVHSDNYGLRFITGKRIDDGNTADDWYYFYGLHITTGQTRAPELTVYEDLSADGSGPETDPEGNPYNNSETVELVEGEETYTLTELSGGNGNDYWFMIDLPVMFVDETAKIETPVKIDV